MATDSPDNPLDRWSLARFALDADGDGRITAADFAQHAIALFFLPGDTALYLLAAWAAPLGRALGFTPPEYGGAVSGVLSACGWFVALVLVSITYHGVLAADRRVTNAIRGWFASIVLRVRIGGTLLRQRWRAWRSTSRPAPRIEPVIGVDLSAAELRVLQMYASLAAGQTLSVSEVASALRTRSHAAQELLNGLRELGLLNRAMGGSDDETSYTLAAAGKAFLAHRAARRRAPDPLPG